jgi:hypothetical protein
VSNQPLAPGLAAGEGALVDGPLAELAGETRLLRDAALLAGLHRSLARALGPEEARGLLQQAGFAQGLADALRVLRSSCFGGGRGSTGPSTPALPIAFEPERTAAAGSSEWCGSWPDALEARASAPEPRPLGCAASAGYTAGWLSGLRDANVVAIETECAAAGAPACRFVAARAETWSASEHPERRVLAESFPVLVLREWTQERLDSEAAQEPQAGEGFEPEAPVIHVWGPVMVIPFSGADESVRAVELIGRDPGAREVAVVVVDLSGTVLDLGFGALALERLLEAIESWGAEPMLAGVSPLSEPVVAELDARHLVLRKDLPDAISWAFQIVEAQKRYL